MLSKNTMLSTSTPLIKDWLYIGGNIAYDRFSRMYKKKSTKESVDTTDSLLGNASVAFAPKDSGFKALFKYSGEDLNDSHSGITVGEETKKNFEVADDFETQLYIRKTHTYALKLGYDFGKSSLSNVTSYQDQYYNMRNSDLSSNADTKALTNELRLNTLFDNGAYIISGLYYQNFTNIYKRNEYKNVKYDQANTAIKQTLAIYTEGRVPLWWGFDMTIGGRYSYDFSKVHFRDSTKKEKILDHKDDYNKNTFTPKVSLGYELFETTRFYMMYQLGYKPGGFYPAVFTPDNPSYLSDIIKSYLPEYSHDAEIGIHSSFFDDKVFLDATLYYIYNIDKQDFFYNKSIDETIIKNVGFIESKGLEFSAKFFSIDSLKISFGGTFGHAGIIGGEHPFTKNKLDKKLYVMLLMSQ